MANTILGNVTSLPFPGRIIKAGDPDSKIVTSLQQRLNEVGCGLNESGFRNGTGVFKRQARK